MASISEKDRKKETESEKLYFDRRNMKRGKPNQPIYRPGSGPLRKTTTGIEETESDTNLVINSKDVSYRVLQSNSKYKSEGSSPREYAHDLDSVTAGVGDMAIQDKTKKLRKPEQTFYVPRPVAQAKARGEFVPSQDTRSERNYQHANGNSHQFHDRSKRYSNHRRPSHHEEWRPSSPLHQSNRNPRQGSEPRGSSKHSNANWQRPRDTRSVDPTSTTNRNYSGEKIHSKPPSGRRHSTTGLETEKKVMKMPNLDLLPPRLKRKYLNENNLEPNYNRVQEENWDGSSLTFQGSSSHNYPQKGNYQTPASYSTLPVNYSHQQQQQHYQQNMPPNNVYYSLPRGRGRFHREFEPPVGSNAYRSVTPERSFMSPCNSRPPTPPPFSNTNRSSTENLSQFNSRPQTPVNVYKSDENYNRDEQSSFKRPESKRTDDRMSNKRNEERLEKSRLDEDRGQERFREVESDRKTPVRSGFNESLEAQLSPVSPATPEEILKPSLLVVSSATLDWSEEVELNDRLEQEALSDALTRSSSIASLMEVSAKSLPANPKKTQRRRNRKGSRKRGGSASRDSRDKSLDDANTRSHQRNGRDEPRSANSNKPTTQQSSYDSNRDRKENFKVPEQRGRRRRNSREHRDHSFERHRNRSRTSRESSFERNRRSSTSEHENWREEIRSRQNSERESSKEPEWKDLDVKKGGIIMLPQNKPESPLVDRPRYPDMQKNTPPPSQTQKCLFDPNNPNKPIVVKSTDSRVSIPGFSENSESVPPQPCKTEQSRNVYPNWYHENTDNFRRCHFPDLLRDIVKADMKLQYTINHGQLFLDWENVHLLRTFLLKSLEYLLSKDLKFCESENVEQHFWKILFHNIIEITRKSISTDTQNKEQYKGFILWLIDDGTKYFEALLDRLEETYNFKLSNFLGQNISVPQKGLGNTGMALVAAQKIFLFLGDLGRYREQVNETTNYGKCRQWYVKAHEINPKNGKPYNQLALLAVYARRKLDAVYYYMRSLMSTNPVLSAKESLLQLFEENKKKYEQGERKRREERIERARLHMKEKESESASTPNSLRKEIWIHPDSGRRVHRTTSAVQEQKNVDSEEEDLASLSSVEVNKRFVTSYLHVHGKLFNKVGMESFQEAALQMLKEFRALLQHSPVPLPCNRFLQLLALNMFAIENNQLKDPQLQSQSSYRSEVQERALVVSLQMFNLILERCVSLLQEHISANSDKATNFPIPMDVQVLLPAVKIWCDWMMCHSNVWNPPPSTQDYRVGPPGDAWSRLASLMNLLEKLEQKAATSFESQQREGYEQVRLPEDSVLSGFTPLMVVNIEPPVYVPKDFDIEMAQFQHRLNKLLFFGTVFLCGLEPPVLKLEFENGKYVSVVCTTASRDSPTSPVELNDAEDLMLESFSEDEEEEVKVVAENTSSEIRDLLTRKVELEKRQRSQELHRQRVKKILSQSVVSVHIEVRPKYLVPDTNCFIDYLQMIKTIAEANTYTLMVPLVVLSELEGLGKGGKTPPPSSRIAADPQHVVKVAESAKKALEFLSHRNPNVKCITTKGGILSSMTFTVENDSDMDVVLKNDDKILFTCLTFCKGNNSKEWHVEGEPRKLFREVVLLTEDRNLRVKALSRDVPVRELPDFLQWAGLG